MSLMDIIPYVFAALACLGIFFALVKYFSHSDITKSADFQKFRDEGKTAGCAARKEAENKVDEIFAAYETKEKSQ